MNRIRYTLVTDGPSDRLLQYPIDWLLGQLTPLDFDGEWAQPAALRRREPGLYGRLLAALPAYPCDLLFVHRDAEKDPRDARVNEIEAAVGRLANPPPAVCVVPVRMTEAWLLIDEQSLRDAAGNPNGNVRLDLPSLRELENIPDPKEVLFQLLRSATGRSGRRLKRFRERQARQRVAELIDDFSPLDILPAFQALRTELGRILSQNDWS